MSEIKFVEVDALAIQNETIKAFEDTFGETLYPGDERRIFLLQLLQVVVGLKNDINNTGKQNLLRYASGDVLDAMGEFYDCTRIAAQKASVTMQFTLSAAQVFDVAIPSGTRVTPDGKLYFATREALSIVAGNTTGTVKADAVVEGTEYNDYIAGQIKVIVDTVPYVASAINTDESSGGANIESDDNYRERIRLAPASYSTTGPEEAYIYWAKTADSNIADVRVDSPSPGVVRIIVLMQNGELPLPSVLDAVEAIVSDEKRRPLTDSPSAIAPTQTVYNIEFTYYIDSKDSAIETVIRNAVEGYIDSQSNYVPGAVDRYKAWQCAELGRAINPDQLRYYVKAAGASRISLVSPSYTVLDIDEVAAVGTVTVTYGGLE